MYVASSAVSAMSAVMLKYMPYTSFWLGGTSSSCALPLPSGTVARRVSAFLTMSFVVAYPPFECSAASSQE